MDKVKFYRRRQFALGPEYFDFEGWNRYHIGGEYCLTVHPDLTVYQTRSSSNSITLLGYLIDPCHDEKTEWEIISDMLPRIKSVNDIFTCIEGISGRFVIIVKIREEMLLAHDAAGMRQVDYCKDSYGRIWCASQAETLAERLGFSPDQEVLEYRNASIFGPGRGEFWLPNNRTAFREVLQLLPNHYLDVRRGKAIRFWPRKGCIKPISVQEGVRLSVPIIKKSVYAASKKFDLKMGISAGIDSRKTLAATKEFRDKIVYFSHEHELCGIGSSDIRIPAKLLLRLGIPHYTLGQRLMNESFRFYYESSSTFARENKGHTAYTLLCNFGTECTILNSNLAEISQCNYWLPKNKQDGEGLAIATGLYHPLAIREFEKWIQEAQDPCRESMLNILSLFHWEQKGGRWASAAFGEYDIAYESFTPYNNRLLNTILLGISERYRRNGMWRVGLQQIQYMWPEVLSEPINPGQTFKEKLHVFLRRKILHKCVTPWIPIYEYVRFRRRRRRMKSRLEKGVTSNGH